MLFRSKIYELDDTSCPRPECYRSCGSRTPDEFPTDIPGTKGNFKLVRHVSFVDSPGHDILMATMLNGAAVMDATLLLIAGNKSCPQPQTSEHLVAIEIMKLKHILILQNKIDLVKESQAKEQYEQILAFVQGTVAEGASIIPISAQLKYNTEVVCEYLVMKIPVPPRDFTSEPTYCIRSFDVNKPGCEVDDLKGSVAGGSILKGVLSTSWNQDFQEANEARLKNRAGHTRPGPNSSLEPSKSSLTAPGVGTHCVSGHVTTVSLRRAKQYSLLCFTENSSSEVPSRTSAEAAPSASHLRQPVLGCRHRAGAPCSGLQCPLGRGRRGSAGRAFTRDGPVAPLPSEFVRGGAAEELGAAIPIPGLARRTLDHVGASDPPLCSGDNASSQAFWVPHICPKPWAQVPKQA